MLDEVLGRLLADVAGARCVLLVGLDGVVVAAAVAEDGPEPDRVAASLADLFRRVVAAHGDAGLPLPEEFTSGGPSVRVVVRAVTAHYLLVAALDGAGSLGRMRHELRRAAALLEPELV